MIDLDVMHHVLARRRNQAAEIGNPKAKKPFLYSESDLQAVVDRLGYKPCQVQWENTDADFASPRHRQPFAGALADILAKYDLPLEKLAERMKRSRDNVKAWVTGNIEPRPLVQTHALENIHNPLDR